MSYIDFEKLIDDLKVNAIFVAGEGKKFDEIILAIRVIHAMDILKTIPEYKNLGNDIRCIVANMKENNEF